MTESVTTFTVTLSTLPTRAELGRLWRDLEQRGESSFFQSWHWIGTWLDCLPDGIDTRLLRVERGGTLAGLAILVRRVLRRHRLLSSRGFFLNCTGNQALDEITIEHNGFLADRGAELDVTQACVDYLLSAQLDWDELFLDGMRCPEFVDILTLDRARVRARSRRHCHYVDLAQLHERGQVYLSVLGKSTRYKIRRSLREFEKRGPVRLTEACSVVEALWFLERLRHFHQRYWRQKGMPGSFANEFFATFHSALVERAFTNGAIQLLRVMVGDEEIGYLYNFAYRGRVYHYQSGFNYALIGAQYSPGLLCHALAVEHNMTKGHAIYDFMAGDREYKRNLATGSEVLAWQVVQRSRLRFRTEDVLRALRDRFTRRTHRHPEMEVAPS